MPFVFNIPHSGRLYPHTFLQSTQPPLMALRRLEDAFVDKIFAFIPQKGAALMWARFPRAYVDLNRAPTELDPEMFEGVAPVPVAPPTEQVISGHGLMARRTAEGQPLYAHRLAWSEAQHRLQHFYHPYHAALKTLLEELHSHFGIAILIDCHSMPAFGDTPNIVLGDRFGHAAVGGLTQRVEGILGDLGYTVVRNTPYAGGFITTHYGRPHQGIHALQIEIARPLYMNQDTLVLHKGWEQLARHMEQLVEALRLWRWEKSMAAQ